MRKQPSLQRAISTIKAGHENAQVLFVSSRKLNEPIACGPIVMNTRKSCKRHLMIWNGNIPARNLLLTAIDHQSSQCNIQGGPALALFSSGFSIIPKTGGACYLIHNTVYKWPVEYKFSLRFSYHACSSHFHGCYSGCFRSQFIYPAEGFMAHFTYIKVFFSFPGLSSMREKSALFGSKAIAIPMPDSSSLSRSSNLVSNLGRESTMSCLFTDIK